MSPGPDLVSNCDFYHYLICNYIARVIQSLPFEQPDSPINWWFGLTTTKSCLYRSKESRQAGSACFGDLDVPSVHHPVTNWHWSVHRELCHLPIFKQLSLEIVCAKMPSIHHLSWLHIVPSLSRWPRVSRSAESWCHDDGAWASNGELITQ